MRRFWLVSGGATLGVALAMLATLPTRLGFELWHYNASFAALGVASLVLLPLWRVRRFATLVLAGSGIVATATGAVMLYTADLPAKEWVTWWHCVTSVVFMVAFLAHWANNSARLNGFATRLFQEERAWGFALTGAWVGILGFGAWTGLDGVRDLFTRENYLFLSSVAVFAGVALTYALWLAHRAPPLRAGLARTRERNRARAAVDVSLFLANWGALLTGFALLYFADFLRGGDFKYVSKWWHTATSVALLAFVTLHIGFNARLLREHARRYDRG